MVQLPFLITLGQNVLLNGLLTDKAVDVDLPGLAYAVTPVLSLPRHTQPKYSLLRGSILSLIHQGE